MVSKSQLAINGGLPIRSKPMPKRALIGKLEKEAAIKVFDESIKSGDPFRYSEKYEDEYTSKFVKFMGGVGFADGVNSGTNAFFSALGALRLKPGSEVIVPAITDIGGVSPIFFHSLVPIISDIDNRSYNICADEIEPLITKKTKAIVVTHVAGEPVEMKPILSLAEKYNLKIIEDCAQAHGAEYENKKVGSIGDIAFFSTMPGKHHCTGGQGGVVFSTNEELINTSKMVADRGKLFNSGKFSGKNVIPGLNCNMDELSAAIGCVQIQKLTAILNSTNYIGEYIKAKLRKNSKVASVGWQPKKSKCVYWFIRLKIDLSKLSVDKKTFSLSLAAEGVPLSDEYRSTPYEQPWFKEALMNSPNLSTKRSEEIIKQMKFSNVEKALSTHINIFIRENYSIQDIDDILEAIFKVERAYSI